MPKPISIQLYTIRDACGQDFPGSLKRLSEIGYAGVEFAGLHGMSAAQVASLLDDLGLQASAAHIGLADNDDYGALADDMATLGITRVVSGAGPDDLKTVADCERVAARFQRAAQALAKHGLTLCYHNHEWEFVDIEGKTAYQRLLDGAPDLQVELDIYWAAFGGHDPAKALAQVRHRAPLLHVKDGLMSPDRVHTALGAGNLDLPGILAAMDPAVTEWLMVELDAFDGDMWDAVRDSHAYLTGAGLAQGRV